jgi:hypothetical protein
MRRFTRIGAVLFPLILALACTHAEDRRADREYRQRHERDYASQGSERVIAGRLREMTARTITISSRYGDRVLWVDPQTTVTIDGRAAALGDLEPGDEVRASFDEAADGRRRAVSIATRGESGYYREGAPENERR